MHPVEVWWRAGGNWQLLFALSFSRYTSVSYTCLYTHSLDTYNSVDIIYDIYDILIFFADSSLFPGEIEGALWEQLHSRQDGLGSFRKPRVTAEVTTDGSYTPENEHENGKKNIWRCISNVSFRVCVCACVCVRVLATSLYLVFRKITDLLVQVLPHGWLVTHFCCLKGVWLDFSCKKLGPQYF